MPPKTSVKAVILAAGRGSRIQSLSTNCPKCLFEIGPRSLLDPTPITFLERQIDCLFKSGVENICVVVGYRKEQIYKKLEGQKITIVENTTPDISRSGSLHSFQFAALSEFACLDGLSHTLLMDADIVYECKVMQDFLKSAERTSLLVSKSIHFDSEEVRVYGEGTKPVFIGKGMSSLITRGLPCLGEATGIVHFAPEDHGLVMTLMNWLLGNPKSDPKELSYKGFGPARKETEHEELSQRMMMLEKMQASFMEEGNLFMEVDFEAEYEELRKSLYPQILAKETS